MQQNSAEYIEWCQQLKVNNRRHNEDNIQLPLAFDSDFEGGNLDLAAKTFADRIDEYDLILRLDSNCRNH